MPKQFLHGIDKSGLDRGLLWNLRFDGDGQPRADFILNRPKYSGTKVLVAGANFGCGSSREHAVWGLQQYGIQAVIASSFREIFYSNSMNNRLLAVLIKEEEVQALMTEMRDAVAPMRIEVDVQTMTVRSAANVYAFSLSPRHRTMFREGLDMIGASMAYRDDIAAFATARWAEQPWVQDVASRTKQRLDGAEERGRDAMKSKIEEGGQL